MIHKIHHQINKIQVKVILQHIKHQHLVTTMAVGILLLKVEVVAVDLVTAILVVTSLLLHQTLQMKEIVMLIPTILVMLGTMFLNYLTQQKYKNKQVINLFKYKSITYFLLCKSLSYPTTSITTLSLA